MQKLGDLDTLSFVRISRWIGYVNRMNSKRKLENKAIPLQAWTDPEGSRNLRLPDFKKLSTG